MKITSIETGEMNIPLKTPFVTALRTVSFVNDIIVRIKTDTGLVGYGEASPTAVITGDTKASMTSAINDFIAPSIKGMDITDFEYIMQKLHSCMVKNYSAKAAVDMALYDLYAQMVNLPLYKLLGGYRREFKTDLTISLNPIDEMKADSKKAVKDGYDILKIKVGGRDGMDFERVKEIRMAVGEKVSLRVDANQAWEPKEAVKLTRKMEDAGLDIELVEQPVKALNVAGLKFVRDNVLTPILADEAVFSPEDAIDIIKMNAADYINIKLMKTGGIYNALKICAIAEIYDVKCMLGCMLESKLSVSAAAHLAAAKRIITMADLDGAGLCTVDSVSGGPEFNGGIINMTDSIGLGFKELNNDKVSFTN